MRAAQRNDSFPPQMRLRGWLANGPIADIRLVSQYLGILQRSRPT